MKDIKGFEGLYAVTSCGRVYSYKRKKFLKPCDNGHGYLFVDLHKDGKKKNCYIHRLVAEAYIPNPLNLDTVDHINENKLNNSVNNLQWLTQADNARKACNKAVCQFSLDGNLIKIWQSASEAERKTGINNRRISDCCNGKHKTAGNYIWRFEK